MRSGQVRSLHQVQAGTKVPFLFHTGKKAFPQESALRQAASQTSAKVHRSNLVGVHFLAWKRFIRFSFLDKVTWTLRRCCCVGSLWFAVTVKIRLKQRMCETVCLKKTFFLHRADPMAHQPDSLIWLSGYLIQEFILTEFVLTEVYCTMFLPKCKHSYEVGKWISEHGHNYHSQRHNMHSLAP